LQKLRRIDRAQKPKSPQDIELENLRRQLAAAKAADATRAALAAQAAQARAAQAAAAARPPAATPVAPAAKAPAARPPPKRKSVDAQGELDSQAGEAEALLRAQLGKGK
jgi:hypothetical protein